MAHSTNFITPNRCLAFSTNPALQLRENKTLRLSYSDHFSFQSRTFISSRVKDYIRVLFNSHYISIIGPTIRSQGEGSTFSILSFRPRSSFHTSKALKLGGLKIAIKTSGNFEDLQFRENTARDPTKSS